MALAAFATGGLQDRLLQHEPQSITAFLGNPNAREADFMASAEDEHSPPGYAVYCKGCGPGIQERMWSRHAYDVYGEIAPPEEYAPYEYESDRKSTRLNPVTNAHLVCRLLLEQKNKQITNEVKQT